MREKQYSIIEISAQNKIANVFADLNITITAVNIQLLVHIHVFISYNYLCTFPPLIIRNIYMYVQVSYDICMDAKIINIGCTLMVKISV